MWTGEWTFLRYRTYEWGPADALPAGDARLEEDLFFLDHMQGAVEKALAARGYRLNTFGSPDLIVHYHATVSRRIDVSRLDRVRGECYDAACNARVIDYEAATLVLDVVDARTERLVWRGWAGNTLDSLVDGHRRMAREIDEAVRRMVAQLPRGL